MVDFGKLSDPAYRAAAEAARKEEEDKQAAADKRVKEAMLLCEQNEDALTAVESEFIRSLRRSIRLYFKPPSVKQEAWLFDIAARFQSAAEPLSTQAGLQQDMTC